MISATEIFTVDIRRISRTEIDAAYFSMSEERRKKCNGLRNQRDKDLCIAADMLLRRVLSEKLGVSPVNLSFGAEENGKPYLKGGGYHFNVSHSGDVVAAALNRKRPVGIDIEKIKPVSPRVAKRFFSQPDNIFVFGNAIVPDGKIEDREMLVRFFTVWTYKEALVKMTGEGITDNIKNYSYDENNCTVEIFDDYVLTAITKTE